MSNSETRFASALAAWQHMRLAHAGSVTEAETRRMSLEASAQAQCKNSDTHEGFLTWNQICSRRIKLRASARTVKLTREAFFLKAGRFSLRMDA